jgi:hypothetical protein
VRGREGQIDRSKSASIGSLSPQCVNFVTSTGEVNVRYLSHAMGMPKLGVPIDRAPISHFNHDQKKNFSRSVLASSETFAFVNGGNFAQR